MACVHEDDLLLGEDPATVTTILGEIDRFEGGSVKLVHWAGDCILNADFYLADVLSQDLLQQWAAKQERIKAGSEHAFDFSRWENFNPAAIRPQTPPQEMLPEHEATPTTQLTEQTPVHSGYSDLAASANPPHARTPRDTTATCASTAQRTEQTPIRSEDEFQAPSANPSNTIDPRRMTTQYSEDSEDDRPIIARCDAATRFTAARNVIDDDDDVPLNVLRERFQRQRSEAAQKRKTSEEYHGPADRQKRLLVDNTSNGIFKPAAKLLIVLSSDSDAEKNNSAKGKKKKKLTTATRRKEKNVFDVSGSEDEHEANRPRQPHALAAPYTPMNVDTATSSTAPMQTGKLPAMSKKKPPRQVMGTSLPPRQMLSASLPPRQEDMSLAGQRAFVQKVKKEILSNTNSIGSGSLHSIGSLYALSDIAPHTTSDQHHSSFKVDTSAASKQAATSFTTVGDKAPPKILPTPTSQQSDASPVTVKPGALGATSLGSKRPSVSPVTMKQHGVPKTSASPMSNRPTPSPLSHRKASDTTSVAVSPTAKAGLGGTDTVKSQRAERQLRDEYGRFWPKDAAPIQSTNDTTSHEAKYASPTKTLWDHSAPFIPRQRLEKAPDATQLLFFDLNKPELPPIEERLHAHNAEEQRRASAGENGQYVPPTAVMEQGLPRLVSLGDLTRLASQSSKLPQPIRKPGQNVSSEETQGSPKKAGSPQTSPGDFERSSMSLNQSPGPTNADSSQIDSSIDSSNSLFVGEIDMTSELSPVNASSPTQDPRLQSRANTDHATDVEMVSVASPTKALSPTRDPCLQSRANADYATDIEMTSEASPIEASRPSQDPRLQSRAVINNIAQPTRKGRINTAANDRPRAIKSVFGAAYSRRSPPPAKQRTTSPEAASVSSALKPKVCKFWRRGYCRFSAEECENLHSGPQAAPLLRPQMITCYFWQKSACKDGASCKYAHHDTGNYAKANPLDVAAETRRNAMMKVDQVGADTVGRVAKQAQTIDAKFLPPTGPASMSSSNTLGQIIGAVSTGTRLKAPCGPTPTWSSLFGSKQTAGVAPADPSFKQSTVPAYRAASPPAHGQVIDSHASPTSLSLVSVNDYSRSRSSSISSYKSLSEFKDPVLGEVFPVAGPTFRLSRVNSQGQTVADEIRLSFFSQAELDLAQHHCPNWELGLLQNRMSSKDFAILNDDSIKRCSKYPMGYLSAFPKGWEVMFLCPDKADKVSANVGIVIYDNFELVIFGGTKDGFQAMGLNKSYRESSGQLPLMFRILPGTARAEPLLSEQDNIAYGCSAGVMTLNISSLVYTVDGRESRPNVIIWANSLDSLEAFAIAQLFGAYGCQTKILTAVTTDNEVSDAETIFIITCGLRFSKIQEFRKHLEVRVTKIYDLRGSSFWSSKPLERLFPDVHAVLLTNDVFVHNPDAAARIMQLMHSSAKEDSFATRAPSVILARPFLQSFLRRLVGKSDAHPLRSTRWSKLLEVYHELCPNDNMANDRKAPITHVRAGDKNIGTAADHDNQWHSNAAQCTQRLVADFSLWSYRNAPRFGHFTIVHETRLQSREANPDGWLAKYQHVNVVTPSQVLERLSNND